MIVDKVCQMVGGKAVSLENNHIVKISVLEDHIAMQNIVYNGFALKRHSKAHGPCHACGLVRGTLLRSEIATMAVIAGWQFLRLLCPAHLIQPLRGAITAIGMARLNQLVGI